MSNAARPLSITRSVATRLLEKLRIRAPSEINIELIAADQRLFVRYRHLSHEAGHILRTGRTAIVTIDQEARNSYHWRWVVAHELGHFLRHPTADQFQMCTQANLHDWRQSGGMEVEANEFAAELLMPQKFFAKRCDLNKPSLHDVEKIATEFQTSLTAAAVRFATFAPEPIAVVYSKAGKVQWARPTRDFPFFIKQGHELTGMTYAGDIFAGKATDGRPHLMDGSGWTDADNGASFDLQEHSIKLGRYDAVLTLLWYKWQR